MRFACNAPVEVKLPDEVTIGNQLQMTIEYDDVTKKSGRVGSDVEIGILVMILYMQLH